MWILLKNSIKFYEFYQPAIEPSKAFVSNNLLEAISRVSVHELANKGTTALVLHTRLDQINRVNGSCADGCKVKKKSRKYKQE
jgi:hypothetical protein